MKRQRGTTVKKKGEDSQIAVAYIREFNIIMIMEFWVLFFCFSICCLTFTRL